MQWACRYAGTLGMIWRFTQAHRCMKRQHSRRSVVDFPRSGVSDSRARYASIMTHTRLALAEKEHTNDLMFLVCLSFHADGVVYSLRNASGFFFSGNTDRHRLRR